MLLGDQAPVSVSCVICEQNTSHVTFFSCSRACLMMSHTTLAQVFVRVIPSMCHAPVCVFDLSSTLSSHSSFRLSHLIFHPPDPSSSMWIGSEQDPLCTSPNEEFGTLANNAPLTGFEPNFFDDYHFSETTEIFIEESSSDSRPSNLHDTEISDDTIGRALSSPLFTHEREQPAGRRQACHSPEECLLSSQSLSVGHVSTRRPLTNLVR